MRYLVDEEGRRHIWWRHLPKWMEESVGTYLFHILTLLMVVRTETTSEVVDGGMTQLMNIALILGGPDMVDKVRGMAKEEYRSLMDDGTEEEHNA